MGIFGWSLPAGCNSLPDDEEQAIDLSEDRTIKGHGRRQHGLCGKDADLDYGGQLVVDEAFWLEDGTIAAQIRGYASIVPAELAQFLDDESEYEDLSEKERLEYEAYMDYAQELVCGEGYSGEWDGDYWVFGETFTFRIDFPWNDGISDEENIDAACSELVGRIFADENVKGFQQAMTSLSKALDLEQYREGCNG